MSIEKFNVFCPKCVITQRQAIVIDNNDLIFECPNCQTKYNVDTVQLSSVHTNRDSETGKVRYFLETEDDNKTHRFKKIETKQGIKLKPGTKVTFVWRGHQLVGISDHDRGLWFNIETEKKNDKLNNFYRFMFSVVIVVVILQLVRLIPDLQKDYHEYGLALFILTIFTIVLLLLVEPLISRIGGLLAARNRSAKKLPSLDD